MKELLLHRKNLKARKPVFLKQDTHKKPGIAKKWSRPRGIDSKMRLRLNGYRRMVTKGWKSPAAVSGLHPTGLKPVLVHNEAEARSIDRKSDGLMISSNVGLKKRIQMLKIAQELGLTVLNVKDPAKFIADAEKGMADRKKDKAEKAEKPKADKTEKAAKEKKAEKSIEELAEDDKREAERKEQERLLIKRE
jgi:large subunit ribosomal protein L32e